MNHYTLPWKASFDRYSYSPRWIDNQHLIYPSPGRLDIDQNYRPEETYVINPFTFETVSDWQGKIDPFSEYSFFPALDWTRAVYDAQWFDNGLGASVDWGVYNPQNGDKLASLPLPLKYPSVAWSPDSSQFLTLGGAYEENQQILLVDRDGKAVDTILNVPPDLVIESGYATQIFEWTADNRYVIFRMGTKAIPRSYELYIADFDRKQIFKTCMGVPHGFAPSPDGKLLAIMGEGRNSFPVMVFNLENWTLYTIAYHYGGVIGWRGD
ncbi:MAG: hypothetical protein ABI690_15735 [Chloroflexota bacterium]